MVAREEGELVMATTEFWFSLHDAGGVELAYAGYERQLVSKVDGAWRHGGGAMSDRPIEFPTTSEKTRDAAMFGVSLARDSDPVMLGEIHPIIALSYHGIVGVTPQIRLEKVEWLDWLDAPDRMRAVWVADHSSR